MAKRRRVCKTLFDDLHMAKMRLAMCSSYLDSVLSDTKLKGPNVVDAFLAIGRMKNANVTLQRECDAVLSGEEFSWTSGGKMELLVRISEQCDICCVVGARITTDMIPFEPVF